MTNLTSQAHFPRANMKINTKKKKPQIKCQYHKRLWGSDRYFDEEELDKVKGKWACNECEEELGRME